MKYFGVVGNPIMHSKSPLIFKAAYSNKYQYLYIFASSSGEAMELFWFLELDGINVTSPFKDATLWGEGVKSDEVRKTGFLNTILREGENLFFYNTDTKGIELDSMDVKGKRCIVIGAGGAGVAAAYSMHHGGADVTMINRTLSKSQIASKNIGCKYSPFSSLEYEISDAEIVINTITQSITKEDWFNKSQLVIDAIYNNSTLRNVTNKYVHGYEWLINQGVASYRIFTGEEPDIEQMRKAIEINRNVSSITIVGIDKRGESISKGLSNMLSIPVMWQGEDAVDSKKLDRGIVIWLCSLNENKEQKKYFMDTSSLIINTRVNSLKLIIELIYGEVSKII